MHLGALLLFVNVSFCFSVSIAHPSKQTLSIVIHSERLSVRQGAYFFVVFLLEIETLLLDSIIVLLQPCTVFYEFEAYRISEG